MRIERADPATSELLGGDALRPLGKTEDLGRELLLSLDREQRRQAVVSAVAGDGSRRNCRKFRTVRESVESTTGTVNTRRKLHRPPWQ